MSPSSEIALTLGGAELHGVRRDEYQRICNHGLHARSGAVDDGCAIQHVEEDFPNAWVQLCFFTVIFRCMNQYALFWVALEGFIYYVDHAQIVGRLQSGAVVADNRRASLSS